MSDGGAGRGLRLAVIAVVAADPIDIPCASERWRTQHDQCGENRDNAAFQHGGSSQQKSACDKANDLNRYSPDSQRNGRDFHLTLAQFSAELAPCPQMGRIRKEAIGMQSQRPRELKSG